MKDQEAYESNYLKYRGKCKQYIDAAIKKDPSLSAVRGYYFDLLWGKQPHWWCKRKDGSIYDPTADQFPTKGTGVYEEFDGICECEICGKEVEEKDAIIVGNGNHAVCSNKCHMTLVGF